MKAVILAAGKGTRMGDLTQSLPKPMLPVEGKPILEHIIEGLKSAGIREICLITGWKAEVIESHFRDGSAFGVEVTYRRQEVQDGTGRAALPAREIVGNDDFLLTYGDILVRPETYARMVKRYGEDQFAGLLTVTEGEDVTKGGINFFDDAFCLSRLVEKPTHEELDQLRAEGVLKDGDPVWYNAGIYIFAAAAFDYMERLEKSPRGEYELTDAITGLVKDGQNIAGLKIEGRWVDVRDPEVLASLKDEAS
ncbi:MAG: nucleotidyltransferase family protein [Limisphaerales bacterium]|jgi:dTDP-glucose pyrophosphorylase|nr:nucleotidyl transferase [Pedosphaera sp.]MBL6845044.1 nucleotidyltransferase family protein [Verrucomicrobiae bacterium]RZO67516.1 MAG: nucleotidyltransferase family protein [Limisphaerales bacterium]HAQ99427.1 nucleotidyl transferase [Verrucomicrobiales bacterium]HBP57920.1 nucleotidyl transferase [Verrucomicrobiales bacterium]|tara:strand:- start:961 stop:1713 length:753 start_codon:yes stop_codon:yes gene_type:complete